MAQHVFELLRGYLASYGYWAIAGVLLLENAGLPLPGETILLLASFLAYSEHRLHLSYIIVVAVVAATLGDNLGFVIGSYGGRPLLDRYGKAFRIAPRNVVRGENIFRRYGAATILVARFIAGMRIIAGPLAGVLRMPWRRFVICNFLGAAVWVTVVSSAGYGFGEHWDEVVSLVRGINVALLVAAVLLIVIFRRRANHRS
jgi:membrane-associated protein